MAKWVYKNEWLKKWCFKLRLKQKRSGWIADLQADCSRLEDRRQRTRGHRWLHDVQGCRGYGYPWIYPWIYPCVDIRLRPYRRYIHGYVYRWLRFNVWPSKKLDQLLPASRINLVQKAINCSYDAQQHCLLCGGNTTACTATGTCVFITGSCF